MYVASDGTEIYAGILFRMADVDNYMMIQALHHPEQPNSCEIELIEVIDSIRTVVRKVNVGLGDTPYFAPDGVYTLKVQTGLDNSGAEIVQVWLDGKAKITYAFTNTSPIAGTRWGFAHNLENNQDIGTTFDDWVVKAL